MEVTDKEIQGRKRAERIDSIAFREALKWGFVSLGTGVVGSVVAYNFSAGYRKYMSVSAKSVRFLAHKFISLKF